MCGDTVGALDALRAWVKHNPTYSGLQLDYDSYSDGSLMDEVTQLVLAADKWSEGRDKDVAVLLGVLYNVAMEYDSALDCFRRALSVTPDDYTLLNKVMLSTPRSSEYGRSRQMIE